MVDLKEKIDLINLKKKKKKHCVKRSMTQPFATNHHCNTAVVQVPYLFKILTFFWD